MFRNFILFFIVLFGCLNLTAQQVEAQTSRLYFAGYLGLNTFNDQDFEDSQPVASGDIEIDNTVSFGGALGLRLSRQFRVEAELSYRNSNNSSIRFDTDSEGGLGGEIRSWIGMANAYYDFDVPWMFQPYVSAGLGIGIFDGEIDDSTGTIPAISESATTLTWQLGTGLKYRPNSGLAYTFGYRYLDSTDLELDTFKLDYNSHEFRVGIEYDLPTSY